MNRIFVILLMAVMSSLSFEGLADVKGRITDDLGQPIDFAQLVLFDRDSVMIANAASLADGTFNIPVPAGSSGAGEFLSVSCFGYAARTVDVVQGGDMGDIILTTAVSDLKEITVSASRPTTKIVGNSLLTRVDGTYLADLSNATEVLGWLPTVSEKDGKISVFGKGAPVIYINGRKVASSIELEQLSASDIKDVKVISNPGSRYDASKNAVILIKTKKAKGEGLSLNTRLRGDFGSRIGGVAQVDLNYRLNGLDLGMTGSGFITRKNFGSSSVSTHPVFTQKYHHNSYYKSDDYNLRLYANYQINDSHFIGAYYRVLLEKEDITVDNHSDVESKGLIETSITGKMRSLKDFSPTQSSNIYYNGKIGNFSLDLNIDYRKAHPTTDMWQTEVDDNSLAERTVTSFSGRRSRLWAEKFVASYEKSSSRFEIGNEYTNSSLHMDYDNPEGIVDASDNRIRETNSAFFAEYAGSIGNIMHLEGGLRYEHVNYEYVESGMKNPDMSRRYDNFFPYASVSTTFNGVSLGLSYTDKTSRPSYGQLDGSVYYLNRFQYTQGNPKLSPVNRRTIELMCQKGPLLFQATFVATKNPILMYSEHISGENDVFLSTYKNGKTIRNLNLLASYSIGRKKWDSQLSAGMMKQWYHMDVNGVRHSLGTPIFSINWQTSVKLPWKLKLMWDYSFQTRGNVENMYVRSQSVFNIALYRTFCNGKFDLRIAGKDLLDGSSMRGILYSGDMQMIHTERFDTRRCEITFRYHLNVTKSKYKGTGAGNLEKERL